MQKNGYLRSKKVVENGRIRINYRTTARGSSALRNIRPKINELVSEVLDDK
jgi:DNA-binding PadR family transcriptional regulator